MKSAEEIMEILEAYDLAGSYRGAAELAGCDHHTVKRLVARRDAGLAARPTLDRDRLIDGYRDKLAEWVDRSGGKLRADVAHDKLAGLGYVGSERSTAGRSPTRRGRIGPGTAGCSSRGSQSRACGSSSTGDRDRRSAAG